LVHWPLMGGLLHLVQRGGAWAGCGPAQSHPRCTKCNSPPINGQCTNFILFDVALPLRSIGLIEVKTKTSPNGPYISPAARWRLKSERSKVTAKDAKLPKSFSAVTPPNVFRCISSSDHNVPVPGAPGGHARCALHCRLSRIISRFVQIIAAIKRLQIRKRAEFALPLQVQTEIHLWPQSDAEHTCIKS